MSVGARRGGCRRVHRAVSLHAVAALCDSGLDVWLCSIVLHLLGGLAADGCSLKAVG